MATTNKKALYKTSLPKGQTFRGFPVNDGGQVELEILSEKDGVYDLGDDKGEVVIQRCKEGVDDGQCVVMSAAQVSHAHALANKAEAEAKKAEIKKG